MRTPGRLLLAAALTLTGCISMTVRIRDSQYQSISAGAIGCPSAEIAISGQRNEFRPGDDPPEWRAECRGHRYICSGIGYQVHCTEELTPTGPAAPR